MPKERHIPVLEVGLTALGLWALTLSLSPRQREAIRKRDDEKCQAPFPHRCLPNKLQVHHILPQGYLKKMGIPEEFRDDPLNVITLCENSHKQIHPDWGEALRFYWDDKEQGGDAFKVMMQMRGQTMDEKMIYWRDGFDRQLQVIAMRNTAHKREEGWEYPNHKHR